MNRIALVIFVLIGTVHLIAVTGNLEWLVFVSKPLIMISLMIYYLTGVARRNMLFLTAIFFCWLGDVLLMFQQQQALFFLLGLAAFLAGHVLYVICYRKFRWPQGVNELLVTQKIRYAMPVVIAGSGLVAILFPNLGDLTVPVIVYAFVISLMTLQALFRFGFTTNASFVLVFIGAIFFMISDSLLAINKFMQPLPFAGLAIMLTYILAQYLIVEGVLRHKEG